MDFQEKISVELVAENVKFIKSLKEAIRQLEISKRSVMERTAEINKEILSTDKSDKANAARLKTLQKEVSALRASKQELQSHITAIQKETSALKDVAAAQDKTSKGFSVLTGAAGGGAGAMKLFVGSLAGISAFTAAGHLLKIADQYNVLQGKIKTATFLTGDFLAVSKELQKIASTTGTGLEGSVEVFQRLSIAGRDLGRSNTEVLRLVESVQKLGVIGGSSNEALKAGLLQFGQAMSAGIVRAEELNSIVENLPYVAQKIADGLGVSVGELRKMVLNGEVLSSKVFEALLKQSSDIDAEFSRVPVSMERATTKMQQSFTVLTGSLDKMLGTTTTLAGLFERIATSVDRINTDLDDNSFYEKRKNSVEKLRKLKAQGRSLTYDDYKLLRIADDKEIMGSLRSSQNPINQFTSKNILPFVNKLSKELEKYNSTSKPYIDPAASKSDKVLFPLSGQELTGANITSGFKTAKRPGHTGIDISTSIGTKVIAPLSGQVTRVFQDTKGGGLVVETTSNVLGNQIVNRFLHLSNASVSQGQVVKRGQLLGLSGNSGKSTGPHLHLRTLVNGHDVDPVDFLKGGYDNESIASTLSSAQDKIKQQQDAEERKKEQADTQLLAKLSKQLSVDLDQVSISAAKATQELGPYSGELDSLNVETDAAIQVHERYKKELDILNKLHPQSKKGEEDRQEAIKLVTNSIAGLEVEQKKLENQTIKYTDTINKQRKAFQEYANSLENEKTLVGFEVETNKLKIGNDIIRDQLSDKYERGLIKAEEYYAKLKELQDAEFQRELKKIELEKSFIELEVKSLEEKEKQVNSEEEKLGIQEKILSAKLKMYKLDADTTFVLNKQTAMEATNKQKMEADLQSRAADISEQLQNATETAIVAAFTGGGVLGAIKQFGQALKKILIESLAQVVVSGLKPLFGSIGGFLSNIFQPSGGATGGGFLGLGGGGFLGLAGAAVVGVGSLIGGLFGRGKKRTQEKRQSDFNALDARTSGVMSRFNQAGSSGSIAALEKSKKEINKQILGILAITDHGDLNPETHEQAKQRLEQLRNLRQQINDQLKQIKTDTKQFVAEMKKQNKELAHQLQVDEQKNEGARITLRRKFELEELDRQTKELLKKYRQSETAKTEILKNESLKRQLIEKDATKSFADQAKTLEELLKQRDAAANADVVTRRKSRSQEKADKLTELDKQLISAFQSVDALSKAGILTPADIAGINKLIKSSNTVVTNNITINDATDPNAVGEEVRRAISDFFQKNNLGDVA